MLGEYRVLTGPTAGGKTGWLVRRGRARAALAISADSRQLYRYMDLGTGKATAAEQAVVPHFALDLLDPDQAYSVYQYVIHVAGILQGLASSGEGGEREVWIIGGTGLYIRALTADLELGLAPRQRLREVIQDRLRYMGARVVAEALGLTLNEPDNPVRVQRAAEQACSSEDAAMHVYLRAGLLASDYAADNEDMAREPGQAQWDAARATLRQWRCLSIHALDPGRDVLQRNIEKRVAAMFAMGLLDEVHRLRELGYSLAPVVADGIGYREAAAVIDNRMGAQEAINQTIIRTRQYAKRQRTYFRGQGWASVTDEQLDAALAGSLAAG